MCACVPVCACRRACVPVCARAVPPRLRLTAPGIILCKQFLKLLPAKPSASTENTRRREGRLAQCATG
eukprot:2292233-Alexandrium_andersonii.AAC.1